MEYTHHTTHRVNHEAQTNKINIILSKHFPEMVTRRLRVLIKVPSLVLQSCQRLPTLECLYIFAGVESSVLYIPSIPGDSIVWARTEDASSQAGLGTPQCLICDVRRWHHTGGFLHPGKRRNKTLHSLGNSFTKSGPSSLPLSSTRTCEILLGKMLW